MQKDEQRVHINLQQLYGETQDESVRQLMNSGFVDMIRCPIRAQNRLVGSISLLTKKSTGFSAAEVQMSDQLPLAKAALAALHLESQRDLVSFACAPWRTFQTARMTLKLTSLL